MSGDVREPIDPGDPTERGFRILAEMLLEAASAESAEAVKDDDGKGLNGQK